MSITLEIESGPLAGKTVSVAPGQKLRVGRTDKADLVVAGDAQMSGAHFSVTYDGTTCVLRDLRSVKGTFHNGAQIGGEVVLQDGDRVGAGESTFVVRFARVEEVPPAEPVVQGDTSDAPVAFLRSLPEPLARDISDARWALLAREIDEEKPPRDGLVALLRAAPEPLFAILDAARDDRVLTLLRASGAEYQSLYEGVEGDVLSEEAPYLVRLPPEARLLPALARGGWGESWGIYLTSKAPFREVRRHFRRFLMVKDEDGTELYFRFYDPRVLRVFLPTANALQGSELFGDVSAYLMEAEDPSVLLRFTLSAGALAPVEESIALPFAEAVAG